MKLIYVAGAYRAPTIFEIANNIRLAESVAAELWRRGAAVICPHKNTAFLDGVTSDENFLAGTMLMLEKCDAIVMLPNWRSSTGAEAELMRAVECNLYDFDWEDEKSQIYEFISYQEK